MHQAHFELVMIADMITMGMNGTGDNRIVIR